MGLFSDSSNEPEKFVSSSTFRSSMSKYSKSCKVDPEDNKMLICKITETKTVRNNGKPQEETTE
jgi:hypothetical protein